MSEEFEAPPIGGENVPFKEMQADKPEPEQAQDSVAGQIPSQKQGKKIWLIVVLVAFFCLTLGLFLGLMFKGQKKPLVSPSPSPAEVSPSPLPSLAAPQVNLEERVSDFKRNLQEVDLEESLLNPPEVDFNIRFELEE